MKIQETARLGHELETIGHAQTTFEALEIEDFESLAVDLRQAVEGSARYVAENAGERTGVLMFRDENSLGLGRQIATQVVERLFATDPEAIKNMGMYAINHYVAGNHFLPHQDYFDGTVVIMTTMGRREFDVYKKEPEDDVFEEIDTTYELTAGSIVLLNGYKDLGHAARCIEGPSMSVVCDTPGKVSAA
jgi:hypothetical protein